MILIKFSKITSLEHVFFPFFFFWDVPVLVSSSGATPSYNNNKDVRFDKAWDENISTYYDYKARNGGWTQAEFSCVATLTEIRYYPRNEWNFRMNQGTFYCLSAGGQKTLIGTIENNPVAKQWTSMRVNAPNCKQLKYESPENSHGNVAEIAWTGTCSGEYFLIFFIITRFAFLEFLISHDLKYTSEVWPNSKGSFGWN